MSQSLVVFGTGSFAELARFYFDRDSRYRVKAFTADRAYLKDSRFEGLPVVPFEDLEQEFPPSRCQLFVAVGYRKLNRIRAAVYEQARRRGYTLASYVSSRATCWPEQMGDNCFIFEDNTIQPFVRIGSNVIIWSGNHIGHHSRIGNHCFLASHVVVSGHVEIGEFCFLGVNATIRDSVSIGAGCLIGAGALIMKSTKPGELYIQPRTRPDPRSAAEIEF